MKILIINGHPDPDAFNAGLAEAYKAGAEENGAQVRELAISSLRFDPNLRYGYRQRTELEPDLLAAWEDIRWADHLVWIHPVWWGGLPALTKGFIDRLFLPGMVFRYRPDSVWWDKLLSGKTARIITTLDQPGWYYRLFFRRPSVNQLKRSTLEFCGVSPVKITYVGTIRGSNEKQRNRWLQEIRTLGKKKR